MPGAFKGIDKRTCGHFSVGVAEEDAWDVHVARIDQFLSTALEVLAYAKDIGVVVEIDTAVFESDYRHDTYRVISFCLEPEILAKLAQCSVTYMVSVYGSQPALS
jgi:hypothetical protein